MARSEMRLQDLRVPVKVALAFAVVLTTIIAVGALLLINLGALQKANAATERAHRTLAAAEGVRFALARQENSLRGYLLTRQDYYPRRIATVHRPLFEARLAELRTLSARDAVALARIDRLRTAFADWRRLAADPAMAMAANPAQRASAVAMIGRDSLADRLMDRIEAVVSEIESASREALVTEAGNRERAAAVTRLTMVLGLLLTVTVAAAMGLWLSRGLATPIVALTGVMRRLAAGDHAVQPPAADRADEIGDMAKALVTFREAAIAKARLEVEAEASHERAEALMVQAQTANRAKSEFLATMTHELRTPLNGILGMAQIMAGDELAPAQRQRLTTIGESGRALLDIINDVLDLSKIEAGHLEITPAPFDLGAFADSLAALYRPLAAEKGLDFSLSLAPSARGLFMGDAVCLRQVASNLLSNALKFTDAGSIAAEVDVRDGCLVLAVSDTGVGVPLDRQATLFDRFVQADATATRRFGGTGLGLTICRDIAGLMGGSIAFTSQPGQGSRFVFEAPLAPAEAPAAVAAPRNDTDLAGVDTPRDSAPQVLVVDDNAVNRTVLQTLLGQFDIASEAVVDGVEAVAAWEAGHWDVILMDVHMPRMDGISATQRIRELELASGRARTPIIAVTASVLSHETDGYFLAGMDGFVAKPIEARTMLAALQQTLGG